MDEKRNHKDYCDAYPQIKSDVDGLNTKVTSLEKRTDRIESQMDELKTQQAITNTMINNLGLSVDKLTTTMNKMIDALTRKDEEVTKEIGVIKNNLTKIATVLKVVLITLGSSGVLAGGAKIASLIGLL